MQLQSENLINNLLQAFTSVPFIPQLELSLPNCFASQEGSTSGSHVEAPGTSHRLGEMLIICIRSVEQCMLCNSQLPGSFLELISHWWLI